MKATLEICIFLTLLVLPIHVAYWKLFRPLMIERLKYRVFKARDDLRLGLALGEIGKHERAYPIIEKYCNHSLLVMDRLDILELFSAKLSRTAEMEARTNWETVQGAGPHVREIFRDISIANIGASLVNSPGVVVPLLILAVLAIWFTRVKAYANRKIVQAWWLCLIPMPA